jgi:hypothetical protein
MPSRSIFMSPFMSMEMGCEREEGGTGSGSASCSGDHSDRGEVMRQRRQDIPKPPRGEPTYKEISSWLGVELSLITSKSASPS